MGTGVRSQVAVTWLMATGRAPGPRGWRARSLPHPDCVWACPQVLTGRLDVRVTFHAAPSDAVRVQRAQAPEELRPNPIVPTRVTAMARPAGIGLELLVIQGTTLV